ncbi:hypothetical protein FQA39_LY17078 [Lamprigera yunnana]|nr:hypothetical protein FQA39_LY17078 [Lamprigera yunnana]
MEKQPGSDAIHSDSNNDLNRDPPCIDRNDQVADYNSKFVTSVVDKSPLKKIEADTIKCVKSGDEQLFDLTVVDDDSVTQLPSGQLEINKADCIINEGATGMHVRPVSKINDESREIKEILSKQLNVSSLKAPEIDSLILTADEELETEMFLSEKEKTEKWSDSNKANVDEFKKGERDEIAEKEKISVKFSPSSSTTISNDKRVTSCSEFAKARGESKNVYNSESKFLWVSNINHSLKAAELKQFITKVGKVVTAKIVTDGKKCYGYVVMDNFEDANECLKVLNNTTFEGRKITVSFMRPATSNVYKNKDSANIDGKDKIESKIRNETQGSKYSKPKKRRSIKSLSKKTRNSSIPKSRSVSRKCRSRDPLTIKFDSQNGFYRRGKSRSSERQSYEYLRSKLERDRLRRRLLEEQSRSREEVMREMRREEKQRELEFKYEREHRKLQFERELFERERMEFYRLDVERRKIEKERLEVLQERSKLEKEYQETRDKRKNEEFHLSGTIVKPQESEKKFQKREKPKMINDSNYRKLDNKRDRNLSNDSKNSVTLTHRIGVKTRDDLKLGKNSKLRRDDVSKDYEMSVPPPPSLNNEFDLSAERKLKHSDFKRDLHGDRKVDHGGRKIEVIDRKYYPDRSRDTAERKNGNVYRKNDFDDKKGYSFGQKKYDYGRDAKRSRVGEFPSREPTARSQWMQTTNYNESWKTGATTGVTNSPLRYQDTNFSAPSYAGQSRLLPVYYHSGPSTQEYQRYDHCSQNTGRKY